MFDADPFFRLPTELCCAILRDWLPLKSVVRFDGAVCNAEKRWLLLNTVFTSPQCVLSEGFPYPYDEKKSLEWLHLRKLRASGLYFMFDVNDSVRDYFQTYGESIRKLAFFSCCVADYLSLVSTHCRNISCLSFSEAKNQLLSSDVEHFSCNLKALDLSDTFITDDILERIVKQCPNTTHISVAVCASLTDECGSIIGSHLTRLRYLDISNNSMSDTVLLAIAKHNYTTLEMLQMEYCENLVGFGLTKVLEKCTKLWSLHVAYDEDCFVDFEFSLLSNLTELSIHYQSETDDCIHFIVQHCKRVERLQLDYETFPLAGPNLFLLTELTVQRMPELGLLAPFGVPKKEVERFCAMRPEVQITKDHSVFDPTPYGMKW